MKLVYDLLSNYFYQEYNTTVILIIVCLLVNIIQTSGMSYIIANIIQAIEEKNKENTFSFFLYFGLLSILYLLLYYLFKNYQNDLLTRVRPWIRNELTKQLLISNNERLSTKNFIEMSTPINRLSTICFMISNDSITYLIPSAVFLIVISAYFFYKDFMFGTVFVLGNLAIMVYIYSVIGEMVGLNEEYEKVESVSESHLIEILNNLDKIIYRGQTIKELEQFGEMSKEIVKQSSQFYALVNTHITILNTFVYAIVVGSMGYSIRMFYKKHLSVLLFITFINIIVLYRDKMAAVIQQVPDFVEFLGRSNRIAQKFEGMLSFKKGEYKEIVLPFDQIVFENVSFQYIPGEKWVFDKWTATIPLNRKIIGITGISGKGKSTFAKLLLKMYPYEGDIYIDSTNIKEVDPDYIRSNIVYVNQNAKLFNKKIVENMMYGCDAPEYCLDHLKNIMEKSPKIRELYKDLDIYEKSAGSLGEQLSGGQRQVVNIIGGLIHPAGIVILDEPTNALDGGLKREVLSLIQEFSEYKKCILIITHDKDVYPLFQSRIQI